MHKGMTQEVTLVLGGVRSGKSRYALQLAARAQRVMFLATAERCEDEEMRRKIERHRAERPQHWTTIEETLKLAAVIESASNCDLLLIDCLTLFAGKMLEVFGDDSAAISESIAALCASLKAAPCSIVLVSNEVGSGVVPAFELGRRYRDLLGEINQRVAEIADHVILMVAGLPLTLKKSSPHGGPRVRSSSTESNVSRTVIEKLIHGIKPASEDWRQKARQHLDTLTKPLGSLGRLEDIAAQVAAIRGEHLRESLSKAVYVFAADHGVTEERVSAYPREVTRQMVLNFLSEGAAINVLARQHQAALHVVDVGVDADFGSIPGLLHHKVRSGTRNMLREAAMSGEEVEQALSIGYQLGSKAVAAGHTMIAIGEMGIGNTTAASAVTCALTGVAANLVTGRGTGIEPVAYENKVRVVEAAISKHCRASIVLEPVEILRCVGGLEIAAMAGMVLAGARHGLVVVLDGFISTAAAALAVGMAPSARDYLIAGHCSEEPGHKILLDHLQLTPVLSLAMRLGEGTGAVLAMPIIESAMALYQQMATFSSAGVSEATP